MIILVVVTVNAVVGVIQEGKAQKALEALKGLTIPKAIVKREGRKREVLSSELVVGDIVYLDAGKADSGGSSSAGNRKHEGRESALTGSHFRVKGCFVSGKSNMSGQ